MSLAPGKRLLLLAVLASLCATAALAILILLFGDFGSTEVRILATTALVSLYSLLALPGGILLDQRRAPALAWTSLALAVTGLALALWLVWSDGESETLVKLTFGVSAYALAATQISGSVTRARRDDAPPVRILLIASTGLVLLLATLVAVALWAEIDSTSYLRVVAALAVANVLLVVLQPVLRRMAAPAARPAQRLRVRLAGGAERELELDARDFADAAARAIREAEREGARVDAIERLDGPRSGS